MKTKGDYLYGTNENDMRDLYALGRIVIFWIVFMVVARTCFLLYNYDQTSQLSWVEIIKVMLYGLKMDGLFIPQQSMIILESYIYAKKEWKQMRTNILQKLTLKNYT